VRSSVVLLLLVLVSTLWILGPGHVAKPWGSEAVAAPRPALKSDSLNVSARQLERAQRFLHSRGLFRPQPDGHMSPATRAALKAFQKKRGLKITGTLDPQTLVAMQLAPAPAAPAQVKLSSNKPPPDASGTSGSNPDTRRNSK
jgi:peptidoglycan hydrolase-like protein with peptidoglycan-binding domain